MTSTNPSDMVSKQRDAQQNKVFQQKNGFYRNLVWYFYEALRYENGRCYVHLLHCAFLIIHAVNIGLITTQTIYFGNDRISFLNEANRGHQTLDHLLIKDWDSRWEVLKDVNSDGEFAKYTVDDLVSSINFAVQRYYNVEGNSIGLYMRLPEDNMEIKFTYFEYPGFSENNSSISEINIVEKMIAVDKGLTRSGDTVYTYDVLKELDHANISQPIKKMLSTSLMFQMHSVRVLANVRKARCLWIQGEVIFSDLDNNGQVVVDLQTHTTRISCLGANRQEPVLEYSKTGICIAVIVCSSITMTAAVYKIILGIAIACTYRLKKPHIFMDSTTLHGSNDTADKHHSSRSDYWYIFKKLIWDALTIIGDCFNIRGSVAVLTMEDKELELATIDEYTVILGIGCLFSWLTVLRFSKFHIKFNLLFKTMYKAFLNILAYMVCVSILFIGFWMSGYFVIGPYHRKFSTLTRSFETLFSIVKGNEIFSTLTMEQQNADGGEWVLWFTRVYVILFVVVFAVFAISLLVAIFLNAHKAIEEQQKNESEIKAAHEIEKSHIELNTSDNDAHIRKETLKIIMEETIDEQLWPWRCVSFVKCSRDKGVENARM